MTRPERISQAERTELSDTKMLKTAVQLIAENGTEKTTLKDVGELAGYSRGLAGYRFGNKNGLCEFVFHAVATEWLNALKQATSNKIGEDAISAAIDAHYQYCVDTPFHFSAFYILWFESIGPESTLQQVVTNIHSRRARDVMAWIDAGIENGSISNQIDSKKVADFFCAMIVGIVYQWLLSPNDIDSIKNLYEDLKQTMHEKLQPPNQINE